MAKMWRFVKTNLEPLGLLLLRHTQTQRLLNVLPDVASFWMWMFMIFMFSIHSQVKCVFHTPMGWLTQTYLIGNSDS
jgi:hypothetical protein